jgi:uncharacterized glyoxalase superfamily protein PhnB
MDMASTVKRIPDGYHTVTPHLVVRGAAKAIAFYQKAFGAKELSRHPGPDGASIMHAELQIGNSRIFLNDEYPEMGATSPQALQGTPVTLHCYVEDADGLFARAVEAGAQVVMPLADQFWGDRYGMVSDPFGHRWSIASHIKDLTPEQMKQAAASAFSCAGGH